MKYAYVALVLLNLAALPGAMTAALAQSPGQSGVDVTNVKNGPAVLAEVRMLKERTHSGKLTDAEVERLKVIKKQANRNEAMRFAMGQLPGLEVWAEISKELDLTIAEHVGKGGTGIEAPRRSTSDTDTETMALLISFAMADFCADRGQAFQVQEIAKLKERIASKLDELGVPKEKRDVAWQATQRGLKASGMEQTKSRDLARECSQHRETMTGMLPGVLSQDVGKKNPF
jgi:hypothetical protein